MAKQNTVSVTTYTKNVAKSFGYAINDVVGQYNPVLRSVARESKNTYETVKSSMSDIKNSTSSSVKDFLNADKSVLTNLIEDLKTGKWYNKERDEDFDLGFDFDFEDWGDDDDESSSAKSVIAQNDANSRQIISSMNQMGDNISKSVGYSSAKSAEYIVKSNNAATKAMLNLTATGFNQVTSVLLNINSSIGGLIQLNQPMATHIENSAIFFTNTSESLKKINNNLEILVKRTSFMDNKKMESAESMFSNGFDMEEYMDFVRENVNGIKDTFGSLLGIGKMMGGRNGRNISLMQSVTTGIIDNLIPKVIKSSMKEFNQALSNAITTSLYKGSNKARKSSNPIINLLGSIFLPQDRLRTDVDTSNYNKGAVPWDGIARKSLVEVIPTYLAKIYSALGGEEKYYDYEMGKFVSLNSIKNRHDATINYYAKKSGGDFRNNIMNNIRKDGNNEQLKAEVDSFFVKAFMSGEDFDTIKANINNSAWLKKFGLTKESAKYIVEEIKNIDAGKSKNKDGKISKNIYTNYQTELIKYRKELDERIRKETTSGNSSLNHMYDAFSSDIDKYNKNQLYYLRGIYTIVGNIYGSIGGPSLNKSNFNPDTGTFKGIGASIGGEKSNIDTNAKKRKFEGYRSDEMTDEMAVLAYGMTNDQIDDLINKENQKKNIASIKKIANSKLEEIGDSSNKKLNKIKDSKVYKALMKVKSVYEKPFEAISHVIDSFTVGINQLFWGGDGKKGLLDVISEKINNLWNDLKKKLLGEAKDKLEKTGIVDATKAEFQNVKSRVKSEVSDLLGIPKKDQATTTTQELPTDGVDKASRGRKVTKTGLIAVSEGELIIPSELNPFYHGHTNKRQQDRNEQRVVDNFYGKFAPGGTVGGQNTLYLPNNNDKDSDKKGIFGVIKEGAQTFAAGIGAFFSRSLMGDEKDQEKEKKNIFDVIKNVLSEMNNTKGAMVIGGLSGVGVSLLTGAVVGPLAGAAIGAATGLIMKSDKVSEALFGKPDKDGNYDKPLAQFIKKELPTVATGALIGGTAGLFAGSPLMGAIVGSGIGYIKSSDKAKEWLFGKELEDGTYKEGAIPKQLQNKIKSISPSLVAGGMIGGAIGPFGIVGNVLMGSALGYLSTSENFRKYIFGEKDENGKRTGGLVQEIHDKIIGNLEDIFKNTGFMIKGMMSKLQKRISNFLKNTGLAIKKRLNKAAESNTLGGKFVRGATALIGAPVKLTGKALGSINRGMQKYNLRKGYDVSLNGETLDAQGRMDLREQMNILNPLKARQMNKWNNFDTVLASTTDSSQLDAYAKMLRGLQDSKFARKNSIEDAAGDLLNTLDNIGGLNNNAKVKNKILSKIRAGKTDEALELLNESGLTGKQLETARSAINKAGKEVGIANDEKANQDNIRQKLKEKGINLGTYDIQAALGLIERQKSVLGDKNKKSDEEKYGKQAEDNKIGILSHIDSVLSGAFHVPPFSLKGAWAKLKEKVTGKKEEETLKESSSLLPIIRDNTSNNEDNEITTQIDMFGNVHKYTTDNQGEVTQVNNDNETKRSKKIINKFTSAVESLPGIGAAIGGIKGLLGGLGEKLFGDKEGKKKGLLSSILEMLNGENGPLSWLTSILSGTTVGKVTKSLLSKITLKGIITDIVGPGLLLAGLGGAFDSAATAITNGAYGSDKVGSKDDVRETVDGIKVHKDANGNWVDDEGNIYNEADLRVRKGGNDALSAYLWKGTARGIATGKPTLAGKVLGRTGYGKKISGGLAKFTEAGTANGKRILEDVGSRMMSTGTSVGAYLGDDAAKASASFLDNFAGSTNAYRQFESTKNTAKSTLKNILKSDADDATKAAANMSYSVNMGKTAAAVDDAVFAALKTNVDDALAKIIKNIGKLPFVGEKLAASGTMAKMGSELSETITKALGKSSKSLAKASASFAKVAPVITIAFMIGDFTTGWEDARTTLGIVDDPTTGQRALSGLLRLVKNLIPIVGPLIPDNLVVQVLAKYIGPALGIDTSELLAKQQKAQEALNAYNAATGENIASVGDFNKQVLKDYTWTERIGNAAKTTVNQTKAKFNNAKEGIKEKGFSGYMKSVGSDMVSQFMGSYNENGGGLAGAFSGVGEVFGNMLPGIFGEITKATSDISAYAIKGELKNLWSVELSDFSGGNEAVEGTDLKTAVPSVFSRVIGQLPLLVNKLTYSPIALVCKIFGKIGNLLKDSGIVDSIKNGFDKYTDNGANMIDYIVRGDVKGLLSNKMEDDEGNPLGGVYKVLNFGQQVISFIPTSVSWVGHKLSDGIKGIVNKVKSSINVIEESYKFGEEALKNSASLSEFMDFSNIQDDEENPVGGITKSLAITARITTIPVAIAKKIGSDISKAFGKAVGKIKTSVQGIKQDSDTMQNIMRTGDIKNLWTTNYKDNDEDNPIAGVMGGINFGQKVVYSIPTLTIAAGKKIKSGFDAIVDKITTASEDINNQHDNLSELAKAGNVKGIMDSAPIDDEENPLNGIMGGINFAQKISVMPSALFHLAGSKLKESWESFTDKLNTDHESLSTAVDALKEAAKTGDLSKVKDISFKPSEDNPLGGIFTAAFKLSQGFQSLSAMLHKVTAPIKEVVDGVSDTVKKAGEKLSDLKDEAWDKAKEAVNSAWDGLTDWLNGSGSGISRYPSGGNSGFISQYDPRYKDKDYAGSTFAEKGCGPAVATMAANAMGKNMSLSEAVRASKGYQTSGGTTLDYFKSVLGSKGISTQLISGGSSAQIYDKIANGQKVILLGRDKNNISKDQSPFGPQNHYVLATGVDGAGNIIVNDPESNKPRAYDPSILNATSFGVAGGASKSLADENLGYWSPLTKEQIDKFTKRYRKNKSPFHGRGEVFVKAAEVTGLDPRYILAHAAIESAWGTSNYAKNRNNYFGIGAFDSNPDNAYTFSDGSSSSDGLSTGIIEGAKWIAKNYYNGKYKQTSVNKMRYNNGEHQYCTSTTWAGDIASIMSKMPENTKVSYDPTPNGAVNNEGSTTSSSSSSSGSDSGNSETYSSPLQAAVKITSIFSNAFGKIFGSSGNSSNSSGTTSEDGMSADAVNLSGNSDPVDYMKSKLGQLKYSMKGPRDPEQGSADCSSTVKWAISKATGGKVDLGGYTGSQQTSKDAYDIANTHGKDMQSLPAGIKRNDIMFFVRDYAKNNPSLYPDGIGHVGLYIGNGKYIDHGSGMGPKIKDFSPGSHLSLVRRLKDYTWDKEDSGAGSGLSSNSVLLNANLFNRKSGSGTVNRSNLKPHNYKLSSANQDIREATKNMINSISSDLKKSSKESGVSAELVNKLLESIAGLLSSIADNTAPVEKIYKLLAEYLSGAGSNSLSDVNTNKKSTSSNTQPKIGTGVDSNISTLVGVLAELAKG